jgi:hypothetical protein
MEVAIVIVAYVCADPVRTITGFSASRSRKPRYLVYHLLLLAVGFTTLGYSKIKKNKPSGRRACLYLEVNF